MTMDQNQQSTVLAKYCICHNYSRVASTAAIIAFLKSINSSSKGIASRNGHKLSPGFEKFRTQTTDRINFIAHSLFNAILTNSGRKMQFIPFFLVCVIKTMSKHQTVTILTIQNLRFSFQRGKKIPNSIHTTTALIIMLEGSFVLALPNSLNVSILPMIVKDDVPVGDDACIEVVPSDWVVRKLGLKKERTENKRTIMCFNLEVYGFGFA